MGIMIMELVPAVIGPSMRASIHWKPKKKRANKVTNAVAEATYKIARIAALKLWEITLWISMLSPPSKRIMSNVRVVKKGVMGSSSSGENTFKTGPRTMPIRTKNRLLGRPVFLNSKFAKNPTAIMAPTIENIAMA
jgi:hypothetical protein